MDKKNCSGCYNDEYNYGLGGARECFSLNKAKLVKRYVVSIHQPPPYSRNQIREVPDCYSPQRHVAIKPSNITSEGYWEC